MVFSSHLLDRFSQLTTDDRQRALSHLRSSSRIINCQHSCLVSQYVRYFILMHFLLQVLIH